MDGTGRLFANFAKALPPSIEPIIVAYPSDRYLTNEELESVAQSFFPAAEPFVLLGESFSSSIAVQLAAKAPRNLRGVILVTGFISSPKKGPSRWIALTLAPIVFNLRPPESILKAFLIGWDAPRSLVNEVKTTIASVKPEVLANRLRNVLQLELDSSITLIDLPILYLEAQQDKLISPVSLKEIKQIKPQLKVVTLPGPHLLLQRSAIQSAKIVTSFLKDVMESSADSPAP
jgi:pimeloyl-ACP methyl ester carboxylesterase